MLSIEQIENDDYSTNDIADLKFRLDIAIQTLREAGNVTYFKKNESASKIQEITELGLARVLKDHSDDCPGEVVKGNFGYYCKCNLEL